MKKKIFGSRIALYCSLVFLLTLSLTASAMADSLMIASGAGYKKPVSEVMAAFEKEKGTHVDAVFGNIQMVTSQAKQSGEVSCIIGDRKFLKKLTAVVEYADYQPIGKGILVLAYNKNVKLTKVEDIATDTVKSVFMPQDKKAIYGIAGTETLKAYGYDTTIASKVTQVATVPQVVSYLLTGEADAGFINLTEALANADKFGGYVIVPQDKYKDIEIVAGIVKGFEAKPDVKAFLAYLTTDTAKEIFKKYGL